MRLRVAVRTAALASLAGALACQLALDRIFTRPAVVFTGVNVTSLGLGGGSLEVLLRVTNPNPYSLTATGASYRLLVADSSEVGRGALTQSFTIGPRDSVTVRLPLDVSWAGLRSAGRDAIGSGTVNYRVAGELVASTPLGGHTIPFDERGTFAAVRVLGRR